MSNASNYQSSFLGGEWSPFAQGRAEDPRYQFAMDRMLNCYPIEEGAAPRRPGTQFAAATRGGLAGRLLKFDFRTVAPYNIELTNGHMRFFQGITLVTDATSPNVTNISTDSPAVVTTDVAHGWSTGDQIELILADATATAAMPLAVRRQFSATVLTTTTFSISDPISGANVDGTTFGWSASLNVTVSRVTDIVAPWIAGDWSHVRAVQTEVQNGASTVPTALLLHGSYAPETLTAATPSTGFATFALAPTNFKDGPYLDPFPNSTISPDALTGLVNLSLGFAAYDATQAYSLGDYVTSASVPYVSLQGANLNNTPASSPTFWQATSFGAPVGANGFTATDIGRHVRIFSEPPLWASATTYSLGNVVKFNNAYWTALQAMTGSTPTTGSINDNQPGNKTTTWSPNPTGAIWTWGVITALSTSGMVAIGNGTIIGNMSNSAAAFDGITNAGREGCATVGGTGNIQGWIGKNFASPQVITSVLVFPANNGADLIDAANVNYQLFGKHTAPSGAGDGTLLCPIQYTSGSDHSPKTFVPTDPTIAWEYVWVVQNDHRSSVNIQMYIAEVQFFTGNNPVGSGVQVQLRGDPLLYTTVATTWRLGVYNATDPKWPACGCWHEGRLWLSGAVPNRIDASNSNDPFNMAPTNKSGAVGDGNAITYTFNSSTLNNIFWLQPDLQGIVAGTLGGEWLISSPAQGALSPTNIKAVRVTQYGSADIEPRRTGLTVVFVQKFQRRVLEFLADAFSGKFYGPNLSAFAKHLTKTGIEEIAYQDELTPIVWVRTGEGKLVGLTYRRTSLLSSQPPEFWGWHQHEHGGGHEIISISVGPSVDGLLDSLSMITEDPETGVHNVEVMTSLFDEDEDIMNAWFLDNAVVPSSGTTVGSSIRFDGLWHLNGETVTAWVAGLDLGDFVVANGAISVPLGSSFLAANAGLFTKRYLTQLSTKGPFTYGVPIDGGLQNVPAVIGRTYTTQGRSLRSISPQESGARNGPGFAKTQRAHAFGVLLAGTGQGMKFGVPDHMRPALFTTDGGRRLTPTELFDGIWRDRLDDSYSFTAGVSWEMSRPYPATVVALGNFLNTEDI